MITREFNHDDRLIELLWEEWEQFWLDADWQLDDDGIVGEDHWVYNAMGRNQGWYEFCMELYPDTEHARIHQFWRDCYRCYPRPHGPRI